MAEKKTWRDVYEVHPAAEVFPMLPEDELLKLGEDIKKNGLKERIVIWSPGDPKAKDPPIYLLDGRNRLAALELVGASIFDEKGRFSPDLPGRSSSPDHLFEVEYEFMGVGKDERLVAGTDPCSYVISKNIRRRHLTKEQQVDLILNVINASTDFANLARSVKRDSSGHVQGSVKDPIKEKAVEEASNLGISKRTVERAIAKDRGATLPAKESPPQRPAPNRNVEDVVKKILAFIERNLSDKSYETLALLSERLTAAIQHRMQGAARKLSRPEVSGEWETVSR